MYNLQTNLTDFSQSINGAWENPSSKNKYFFYTNPNGTEMGKMSILQKGSEIPIMMDAVLEEEANGYRLMVEGAAYGLTFTSDSKKRLNLKMPEGDVIQLRRKRSFLHFEKLNAFSLF